VIAPSVRKPHPPHWLCNGERHAPLSPSRRSPQCPPLFLAFVLWPGAVAAQDVTGSGMGQGEAAIGVRSDVTIQIEGARSTPANRLQQMTDAATDRVSEIRICYRELASKRPTAAGGVAVRVTLEADKKPPRFEIKEQPGTDPEVTRCVTRELEKATWRKVERPASAVITLEFQNSRAKGEQEMAELRQAAEQVEIHAREGGGYEAGWSTHDGSVSFLVSNPTNRDGIEPVLRKLRDAFAGFADCRRRSEQGGRSPAGNVEAELRLLGPGEKSHAKVISSSVAHPRVIPCIEHLLAGLGVDGASSAKPLAIRVTFGG
jgi:hypothetical protein